ncbi:MAG TPA: helix-turn-helix domain-containing protein, partial [Trueperaceae bacterium]|nr:helix-turn-helix domain-containing protein [Trueperaceae bacterium]
GAEARPAPRPVAQVRAQQWRHLPFSLTHDDVALLAGCARVTATRILGDLKEAGVLDGSRGDYALVPAALQDAADKYVCEVI